MTECRYDKREKDNRKYMQVVEYINIYKCAR